MTTRLRSIARAREQRERERVELLARQLEEPLRQRGEVWVRVDDVDDVEQWRRAARLACHRLGWRAFTRCMDDELLVVVAVDRPVSWAEQRRAALAIDAALRPEPLIP